MELLPLHPKVVHLPIALAVLMPMIAGGLLFVWWRGWLPKRAWIVAAALQGALVASGFVAMQSGEGDEDRVETIVGEGPVEAHEEAAEVFVWTAVGVLVLAVVAALIPNERLALMVAAATVLGTVGVFGLGYRAGEAGGALIYKYGAARAYTTPAPKGGSPAAPAKDKDKDDD